MLIRYAYKHAPWFGVNGEFIISQSIENATLVWTVCIDVVAIWTILSGQDNAIVKFTVGAAGASLGIFAVAMHMDEKQRGA